MARVQVKYQALQNDKWQPPATTTLNVSDTSNSAIKATLLSNRPVWSDIRILDKKVL